MKNKLNLLVKNTIREKINEKFLLKIVQKTLKIVNVKKCVEISLVIVGDRKIKKLNKIYRSKDRVTDVLSFEIGQNQNKKFINAPNRILNLGEILICYPQAKRQAKEMRHSIKKELETLLIHGVLHLLGYDHDGVSKKKADEMRGIEEKVLRNLD